MHGLRRGLQRVLAGLLALGVSMMTHAEQHAFTTSDGVRLRYLEQGDARAASTIVFVPGWTMPASIWSRQMAHFAPRHRVIALDPRSQGDSDDAPVGASAHTPERRARDIAELIKAADLDRPVIVGWSLGVLEALAYVASQGDAGHAALVLVDNSVGEEPAPVAGKGPGFTTRLRKDRQATVHRFVRSMFRSTQPEPWLHALEVSALRTPLETSIALLSWPGPRTRWRDALYATTRPVLYVVTPAFAAQAANVARKRPDIRTEVFAAAGHALFVDEAERFNGLLDDFLVTLARAP